MQLWLLWWNVLKVLRPAFSRTSTFFWFVIVVAGFSVRTDHLGVTSIVRALTLQPRRYSKLCQKFHSAAVKLERLTALWTHQVLALFPQPVQINGRRVLVGDGVKIPKCGKNMPGVKLLHQSSNANTKPTYIMGHSLQAVGMLVHAANSAFAVPLVARIHEGLVFSNRDRRTLLDKMLALLGILALPEPFYFVADAYYAARKIANGLLEGGNHLITRVKSNAVAYLPAGSTGERRRGRPRVYGAKVALKTLLDDRASMQTMASPVYGERTVTIRFCVRDLLWRPAGRLVRFVAVVHPSRGSCLLMSTDTALDALEIIRAYGLRFKIEHSFKQAIRVIGTFGYHFWMKAMKPTRRGGGDQYLHRESREYREAVKRKMHAYHVFIQAGVICQGLLQYLSATFPKLVWNAFGSWLRTIRPDVPPSEFVVMKALRRSLPDFLLTSAEQHDLAKFIAKVQDVNAYAPYQLVS